MRAETFTKADGRTIWPMARVTICTRTEQSTPVNGRMTSKTVLASKHGPMVLSSKEHTCKVKKMAEALSLGLMAQVILVISQTIVFKEQAYILIPMAESMKAPMIITGCMAKEHSPGRMVAPTLEITLKTRSKVSESSFGRMAADIRAAGLTESSTERACTSRVRATKNTESGARGNEFAGFQMMPIGSCSTEVIYYEYNS